MSRTRAAPARTLHGRWAVGVTTTTSRCSTPRYRAHAHVELRIRDAKDSGLANLPSADFAINNIWPQLVLAAQDLFACFATLVLDGDLAVDEPKTAATACCTSPDASPSAPDDPPAPGPGLALAE